MRGPRALVTEVLDALDEAASKEHRPDAIGLDPGGERVVVADEPAGEVEAIWILDAGGKRAEHRRDRPRRWAVPIGLVVQPAHHHVGLAWGLALLHDHGLRHVLDELRAFGGERSDLVVQSSISGRPSDADRLVRRCEDGRSDARRGKQKRHRVRGEFGLGRVGPEEHAAGAARVDDLEHERVQAGDQRDLDPILVGCDAAVDPAVEDLLTVSEDLDAVVRAERDGQVSCGGTVDLATDVLRTDALGERDVPAVDHAGCVPPGEIPILRSERERPRRLRTEGGVVRLRTGGGGVGPHDVPVGACDRKRGADRLGGGADLQPGATDHMLGVGGLVSVSHDEIGAAFESERFRGEEDEGPATGDAVRLRGPDPAVVGTDGVGDAEVAVRLFMVGPRPGERDVDPAGGIGGGDRLDRDSGEDRVAVRRPTGAGAGEGLVGEGLDEDGVVSTVGEAVGDGDRIVRGVVSRGEHASVAENLHRRAVTAARGDRRGGRPSETTSGTEAGEVVVDGSTLR